MPETRTPFRWGRVLLAVIAAEALPVLLLVLIVVAYGFVRDATSQTPEEFAPAAGMWVGPIGGFLATLLFAFWAGRGAPSAPIAHAAAVGIGTAILDLGLGIALSGGAPIQGVSLLSNGGRILAGFLGGSLAARRPVRG